MREKERRLTTESTSSYQAYPIQRRRESYLHADLSNGQQIQIPGSTHAAEGSGGITINAPGDNQNITIVRTENHYHYPDSIYVEANAPYKEIAVERGNRKLLTSSNSDSRLGSFLGLLVVLVIVIFLIRGCWSAPVLFIERPAKEAQVEDKTKEKQANIDQHDLRGIHNQVVEITEYFMKPVKLNWGDEIRYASMLRGCQTQLDSISKRVSIPEQLFSKVQELVTISNRRLSSVDEKIAEAWQNNSNTGSIPGRASHEKVNEVYQRFVLMILNRDKEMSAWPSYQNMGTEDYENFREKQMLEDIKFLQSQVWKSDLTKEERRQLDYQMSIVKELLNVRLANRRQTKPPSKE